jgi:hypothetical protein
VAYGASYGVLGAVISAWPAAAFIGSVEMVMGLVRRARHAGARAAGAAVRAAVPASTQEAARMAWEASVTGGNPLSERALADRFGLPRGQARKIRAATAAGAANGSLAAVPARS